VNKHKNYNNMADMDEDSCDHLAMSVSLTEADKLLFSETLKVLLPIFSFEHYLGMMDIVSHSSVITNLFCSMYQFHMLFAVFKIV